MLIGRRRPEAACLAERAGRKEQEHIKKRERREAARARVQKWLEDKRAREAAGQSS